MNRDRKAMLRAEAKHLTEVIRRRTILTLGMPTRERTLEELRIGGLRWRLTAILEEAKKL